MLWRQYEQKKNLHHSNCAQNKQRDHPFKIGIKKRKGEKIVYQFAFFRNKAESIKECDYTP